MVESTYTTRVLTASEGCFLTQANLESVENAILSTEVYLAVNDSPENWKEITEEEARIIIKKQEEERKRMDEEERKRVEEEMRKSEFPGKNMN